MVSHLWSLLIEVAHHWLAVVTGSTVSLFMLIWEKKKEKQIKWKYVLGIFFVGLVVSIFFAWQDEYTSAEWRGREISRLEEELRQTRQQSEPKLLGEINWYGVGTVPEFGGDTGLIMVATISNIGAPSLAKAWKLTVTLPDGRIVSPLMEMVPKTITAPTRQGVRTFYQMDALYNKTTSPIPTGGAQSGILIFRVPRFKKDEIFQKGTKIALEFQDVQGKAYSCWLVGTGVPGPLMYVPGLQSPVR